MYFNVFLTSFFTGLFLLEFRADRRPDTASIISISISIPVLSTSQLRVALASSFEEGAVIC